MDSYRIVELDVIRWAEMIYNFTPGGEHDYSRKIAGFV